METGGEEVVVIETNNQDQADCFESELKNQEETVDHGEDNDNGDESDVDTDTDTDEIPASFLDLDVWEKLGRKLEDFTLAEMKQLSFRSHRTCIQFYRMYAKVKGFGIRRKHTTTSKIDGHPTSQKLWCNREGFREAKHLNRPDRKRKEKAVTRCGCNASISFKWDHRSDSWYVKDFVPEHNGHDLIPMNQMYFERSHREVTEGDKFRIKALMNSGVKPSITMRNLAQSAGGIREVGFLKKDLYNTCEKFKREEIKDGDTETVLAYLLGKTASDPSFFLRYTRDDYDGINKMFWCDGICQADYKAFGKVIAFDTTYKVNAYQKPFVVVVGVNHHRKTVPLGVALIANEKIDTYIWVLKQLKEAGGNVAPYTIITNGDKSTAAAIKEVFPHAHHRLCLWHLMRNIKGHTNKRFCSGFMKCVDGARTPTEFEEAWEDLMKAYEAVRDKKWAQDLYTDRTKWAEAFMVGQFYAGMRSTQRCESMNSTLKTVITSKIMLYRFVELYDQVLEHIRFEEDRDDYISTHTFPVITGVLPEIKTQAARTYTRNVYDLFLKELSFESGHIVTKTKEEKGHRDGASTTFWLNDCVNKDCNYVVCYNKKLQQMVCCCMKYNSVGLPCRHMFAVMKFTGMVEIPSGCILHRWTIRAKVHLQNTFKDHDFQKRNDQASANGRYAFLTGLSAQLCRMVSSSYDRSTWVRDKIAKMLLEIENEKINPKEKDIIKDQKVKKGKSRGRPKKSEVKTTGNENNVQGALVIGRDVHDITHVVSNAAATSETNPSPVKNGGFVELLRNFLPRTYNTGDAANATDCYEVSAIEKFPTIFDWDPNTDF